jgi:xyloglucan-specific exo-beta-1,4-glucanase
MRLMKLKLYIVLVFICLISLSRVLFAEPYNWKNVVIKGGGFVTGITVHPTHPHLIYARTDVGGAYKWDVTSYSWIPLTDWVSADDYSLLGIESIAIDPSDTTRVYIAAGMYTSLWPLTNGTILWSTDQGKTFQRSELPFKFGGNENGRSIGERLAVDPNQGNILFFGSRTTGLWKSTDYALTWSRVTSFPTTGFPNGVGIGWVVFDSYSGSPGRPTSIIYIGIADTTSNTLYRSTDCGTTWTEVPGQPGPNLVPHHGVIGSDRILYVSYCDNVGPSDISNGAVWKYNSNTGVWTNITPPFAATGYGGLAIDLHHPGTVMVSTMNHWWLHDEMFRSIDSGSNWITVWRQSSVNNAI